jgi:hypothetical protein
MAYQLGLLLLMYCSGAEGEPAGPQHRTVIGV